MHNYNDTPLNLSHVDKTCSINTNRQKLLSLLQGRPQAGINFCARTCAEDASDGYQAYDTTSDRPININRVFFDCLNENGEADVGTTAPVSHLQRAINRIRSQHLTSEHIADRCSQTCFANNIADYSYRDVPRMMRSRGRGFRGHTAVHPSPLQHRGTTSNLFPSQETFDSASSYTGPPVHNVHAFQGGPPRRLLPPGGNAYNPRHASQIPRANVMAFPSHVASQCSLPRQLGVASQSGLPYERQLVPVPDELSHPPPRLPCRFLSFADHTPLTNMQSLVSSIQSPASYRGPFHAEMGRLRALGMTGFGPFPSPSSFRGGRAPYAPASLRHPRYGNCFDALSRHYHPAANGRTGGYDPAQNRFDNCNDVGKNTVCVRRRKRGRPPSSNRQNVRELEVQRRVFCNDLPGADSSNRRIYHYSSGRVINLESDGQSPGLQSFDDSLSVMRSETAVVNSEAVQTQTSTTNRPIDECNVVDLCDDNAIDLSGTADLVAKALNSALSTSKDETDHSMTVLSCESQRGPSGDAGYDVLFSDRDSSVIVNTTSAVALLSRSSSMTMNPAIDSVNVSALLGQSASAMNSTDSAVTANSHYSPSPSVCTVSAGNEMYGTTLLCPSSSSATISANDSISRTFLSGGPPVTSSCSAAVDRSDYPMSMAMATSTTTVNAVDDNQRDFLSNLFSNDDFSLDDSNALVIDEDAELANDDQQPIAARQSNYPAVELDYPVVEDNYPAVENNYPAVEDNYPAVEDNYPAVEDNYPPIEDNYPAVKDDYPAVEDVYPAVEDNYPAVKDDYPAVVGNYTTVVDSYPAVKDNYLAVKDDYPAVEDNYSAVKDVYPAVEDNYSAVKDVYQVVADDYPAVEDDYPAVEDNYPAVDHNYPAVRDDYPAIEDASTSIQNFGDDIQIIIVPPKFEEPKQDPWDLLSIPSRLARTAFGEGRYSDVFKIIQDNVFPDDQKSHLRKIWAKALVYNYTRLTNLPVSERQRLIISRQNPVPESIQDASELESSCEEKVEIITVE